jgi:hypothetical protein
MNEITNSISDLTISVSELTKSESDLTNSELDIAIWKAGTPCFSSKTGCFEAGCGDNDKVEWSKNDSLPSIAPGNCGYAGLSISSDVTGRNILPGDQNHRLLERAVSPPSTAGRGRRSRVRRARAFAFRQVQTSRRRLAMTRQAAGGISMPIMRREFSRGWRMKNKN